MTPLTIYCNADLPTAAAALLRDNVGPHKLLLPAGGAVGVLQSGSPDPQLNEADVAFGQPDVDQIMNAP
ncbi:MAG: D-2-hydroxyacid dehydrogenase, partial [Deltaproteobacteria bacterium]|nr:D-2-hydroxyacid dehydrogenase [Deltaproteobacteria bacterium]